MSDIHYHWRLRRRIVWKLSSQWGGISRPLKFMQIYETKYRSTEHRCIVFRWLYVGSGIFWFGTQSSRSQWWIAGWTLSVYTTELYTSRHSWTGGTHVTSVPVSQRRQRQLILLGYPYARPRMSCAEILFVAVPSIQLGTSFSLYCLLRNPADNDVYNLGQLPDPLHHTPRNIWGCHTNKQAWWDYEVWLF